MSAAPRRVGLLGATGIGVGSMLGAGVFVVWGPAAAVSGPYLIWAVALAGAVALVNALSTAQLAARYPVAGGAYAYGREELAPVWGFVAGIGFVLGKTASVAAVALALGTYAYAPAAPWIATAAVAASWALNARGITRTAGAATALAIGVVAGLVGVLAAGAAADAWAGYAFGWANPVSAVLAGAALVFFAFAGYARIATLGEEVRRPERTIPAAIAAALGIVLILYVALAWVLTRALGPVALSAATEPVSDLADVGGVPAPVVTALAVAACAGSLLALTAGVGRTAMAMAEHRDLPVTLARRNARNVPAAAEGLSAVVALGFVWLGGLGFALQVSASAVLVYYAVANAAAFRQASAGRTTGFRVPRAVSAVGVVACATLAWWLEWLPVAVALGGLALAVAVRAGLLAVRR